jgi:two-component system, NarL family, nitrate/nitrite response regulator NarL
VQARTGEAATRVLLVDDQPLVLESLAVALTSHPAIDVVGTAASAASACVLVTAADPEVAVVDHQLPDRTGVDLAEQLLADRPDLAVLLLADAADERLLRRARSVGCAGFLTKSVTLADLVAATVGASGLATTSPPAAAVSVLSARELEAIRLAARGLSNRAIAEAMFLSPHTIKNYMQSAIRKLGAHSKLEAVTIAVRRGIITIDR